MTNLKKSPKPTTNFGDRLKAFIVNNKKILFFTSLFFILNVIFLATICAKNEIALFSKTSILIFVLTTITTIGLCALIFQAKKRNWPIEKIFLIVGSILGIIYLFAIPIGRTPDEPTHIWRVYSIAEGKIFTENQNGVNGNFLPKNVTELGNEYTKGAYKSLSEKISEPVSDEEIFWKTIGSNPIDYSPQIVGIFTGKILNLPMIITLYLGRLFGLVACIAISFFCLKYIPILKKSLFFILCLPLTIQSFVSISYDGIIFCSAIALITFVLYFIYSQKTNFKISHFLTLSLISAALVAVKPVYLPLCFLLFFIPNRCFKNKKQKILYIAAIFIIAAAIFMLWSLFSVVTEPGNGADTGGQISFIISNPLKYFGILVHNIIDMPILYLQRLSSLEWLDVPTNEFYTIATLAFFILMCAQERFSDYKIKFSKAFRYAVLITGIATVVLIFTALFIQWSQVGAYVIEGVQTRYLLPIFILVPLLCTPFVPQRSAKKILPFIYLYIFIIFLNLNAITAILCAHI